MSRLSRLLVVEDQPQDLKLAADAARSVGIAQVDTRSSIRASQTYLEKGLRGEGPLPDVIILDLDLGYESGYELLRYWHSTPSLAGIPVIVWSILGDKNEEICKLFKVSSFIGKWEGESAIREALARIIQPPS